MRRFIWKMILKIMGWKTDVLFPPGLKKCIIIVAPHTCWQDLIIGLAYRSQFRLKRSKYLGKKELFDGPFGFIFRWSGGLPVDRFSKKNMVDQVVEIINKYEEMIIAISPEGTRKKVDRLKTGFYYIAKKAGIPIVMAGLDFTKKEVIIAEPFYTSDDEAKDFEHIIHFFAPISGKYPELGLAHLLKDSSANG